MRPNDEPNVLAFINNAISADLLGKIIEQEKIPFSRIALILARDIHVAWANDCAIVIRYPGKPSLTAFGQYRYVGFYRRGAALVRRLFRSGSLEEVFTVNNDNLLSNAFFQLAKASSKPPRITVVAEGIMNYQDIGIKDRASWRWRLKPLVARLFGLPYEQPDGHLSGAFETGTDRVVSFSEYGLKAPDKTRQIIPYKPVDVVHRPQVNTCLVVHTGLWQWMDERQYEALARSFSKWVSGQDFERVFAKNHPHIQTGILEDMLPEHTLLGDDRSIEQMAADCVADTVVGTCCTGLVTLKMLRPDIRCIDFGADVYCDAAYAGDQGVIELMRGVGVELVSSGRA